MYTSTSRCAVPEMIGLLSQPTTTRGGPPSLCARSILRWEMLSGLRLPHSFRRLSALIRSAVTDPERLTGTASTACSCGSLTGCSWEDAERLTGHKVSDTTMRLRRDEWIAAGVFRVLEEEALAAYDKIIGFDFSDVSRRRLIGESPCGGEGTGKNPTDRANSDGSGRSLTDRGGIPVAWSIDAANRHDSILLPPDPRLGTRGLLVNRDLLARQGYHSKATLELIAHPRRRQPVIAKQRRSGDPAPPPKPKKPPKMGLRCP